MGRAKGKRGSRVAGGSIIAAAPALQRVAEVAMLFLVFPILVIGWSMALSLPAVIAAVAVGFGDEVIGDLLGGCVIVALLPSAAVASRRLVWWLRVEGGTILLGPAWPRLRIPCARVELIRVGSISQRLRGEDAPLHVPLVITGDSRHQIHLVPSEADRLLEQLLKVCPNAAGISRNGKETLPANPEARLRGAQRMRRFWLLSGGLAGVISGAIGLTLITASLRDDALQGARQVVHYLYLTAALAPAAAYAAFALRRARRGAPTAALHSVAARDDR